jgi:hypothetical protein
MINKKQNKNKISIYGWDIERRELTCYRKAIPRKSRVKTKKTFRPAYCLWNSEVGHHTDKKLAPPGVGRRGSE